MREVNGPADWSQEAHLLAGLFDAAQLRLWQAAGKKSAAKPKPVPRPQRKADGGRRTTLTPDEQGARILAFTARREKELLENG